MKKFLAGLSAVAVLAAGGVAMVSLTSDTANAQEYTTITENPATREVQRQGRPSHRGRRGHALSTAADTIGISVKDLVSGLKGGLSIADVAEANGSSGQAVIDAMVTNASKRIDAAVANGNLTVDEGAERLDQATSKITDRVNN